MPTYAAGVGALPDGAEPAAARPARPGPGAGDRGVRHRARPRAAGVRRGGQPAPPRPGSEGPPEEGSAMVENAADVLPLVHAPVGRRRPRHGPLRALQRAVRRLADAARLRAGARSARLRRLLDRRPSAAPAVRLLDPARGPGRVHAEHPPGAARHVRRLPPPRRAGAPGRRCRPPERGGSCSASASAASSRSFRTSWPPGAVRAAAGAGAGSRRCTSSGRCGAAEPVTYEGRHYRLREARLRAGPVQRPGVPLLIAGGGKHGARFLPADRPLRRRGQPRAAPRRPRRDDAGRRAAEAGGRRGAVRRDRSPGRVGPRQRLPRPRAVRRDRGRGAGQAGGRAPGLARLPRRGGARRARPRT